MRAYEIRIAPHTRGQTIISAEHLNDHAAIRAAKKKAGDKPFEVWRGSHCIYHLPDLPAAERQLRPAS